MKRPNRTTTIISTTVIIAIVATIITFKLWLFGSLFVSSVKSISGSCGHKYSVEVYVIDGDWFCAEKGK